jgi:hypothetical protein
MVQRRYSPEEAFEKLLRSVNKFDQKSMKRYDFHKAVTSNEILLTSPEIDFLFDILTGFKNLPSTLLGQR